MSPDELARAAAELAPPSPGHALPPLPIADVLDVVATDTAAHLVDLWTLRDSLDAAALRPADHAAAVADLAAAAEHLGAALDAFRHLATVTSTPLDLTPKASDS